MTNDRYVEDLFISRLPQYYRGGRAVYMVYGKKSMISASCTHLYVLNLILNSFVRDLIYLFKILFNVFTNFTFCFRMNSWDKQKATQQYTLHTFQILHVFIKFRCVPADSQTWSVPPPYIKPSIQSLIL